MKYKEALNSYQFFSKIDPELLPPKERRRYNSAGVIKEYKKKDIIFKEGDRPRGAYIIIKGMVKVYQINSNGNAQIIFFFSEGEIFGFRPILSNSVNHYSAMCLENCIIKFIERDAFLYFLETSPIFSRQLLTSLSLAFSVLVNRINFFAQKHIRERLAMGILLLNEKYRLPGAKTDVSNIKINRTDLASYIGTTIDVVSRNLKYYTEKNFIRIHGKNIFIIDFDNLLQASGIV